jgi:hypothetical protein
LFSYWKGLKSGIFTLSAPIIQHIAGARTYELEDFLLNICADVFDPTGLELQYTPAIFSIISIQEKAKNFM